MRLLRSPVSLFPVVLMPAGLFCVLGPNPSCFIQNPIAQFSSKKQQRQCFHIVDLAAAPGTCHRWFVCGGEQ
ncbi:hypothetical protein F5B21DRAFT_477039 [Xylaria acuta]|nr:hypothetical protein F5B21DRAFT_477039 [Xylaria acuta]